MKLLSTNLTTQNVSYVTDSKSNPYASLSVGVLTKCVISFLFYFHS